MAVPKLSQEDTDIINKYFGYNLRYDELDHLDQERLTTRQAVLNLISLYTKMRVMLLKLEKELDGKIVV